MKRYLMALLVAVVGLALAGTSARATETKFSGELRVRGELYDETYTSDSDDTSSLWDTRLRLQLDLVASDNLRGVYQIEIGDITWGDTNNETEDARGDRDGGRLGTDEVNVESRQLYVDASLPTIPLNAKLGLMQLTLGHGFVFDETAAALLLSADLEPVKLGFFTMKAVEDRLADDSDLDYYGLFVDAVLQDMSSVGLFGVYGRTTGSGMDDIIYDSSPGAAGYDEYNAYWLGLTVDMALDPLTIAFEADYYNARFVTDSTDDFDSDGWLAYLDVAANMEPVRAGVAGLFATGNDDDTIDDDDSQGFTPILPTDPEDACVVAWDNMFLLDGPLGAYDANVVSNLISGKLYADTTPLPELNLGLSVQGYWKDEDAKRADDGDGNYIGTEVDLDAAYNIYDQLAYQVETAYMFTDDEVWGAESEDIWFLSHKLIYSF